MHRKFLLCLLASLFAQTLHLAMAAGNFGDTPRDYAQSQTETGQSGTGVRGTTGEDTGGGQPYTGVPV
ncbi:hypothetical protein [Methylocaldum szegediense]|uniref:Secreted protein n=1 Tax=Methylocaldum szegediense TaxID=73780 RepID=A0ABN8XCN7_9GAMM|nr:hypothetical protein [Methylocaldum szegediense]CAI8928522.1 exported protein of unknown function [Methylocaldum szegediense]